MKTKTELQLVKLRRKRFARYHFWKPTLQEFNELLHLVIKDLYNRKKKHQKWFRYIDFITVSSDNAKYYKGMCLVYGDFTGVPNSTDRKNLIQVYMHDILIANGFQKDLVREHLYYILEHEVAHYFGMKHEDLKPNKKIGDFGYPI